MKKPILLGLCLVISYISYTQVNNNNLSPSLLFNSLHQYSSEGYNLNAQVSLQSQLSSIPGHPYFGEIGIAYIPQLNKSTSPEISISLKAGSFGPFTNTNIIASLGIINNFDHNNIGYRGGLKVNYDKISIDSKKLVWSDPDFEPTVYNQSNQLNISCYLGGWISLGTSKRQSTLAFSFESDPLLKQNSETTIKPWTGRYVISYNKDFEDSKLFAFYQFDLDKTNDPLHLINIQYQFPFKIYAGIVATSSGLAGITSGYIWKLEDYWDTTIDLSYRYIESFGEYASESGTTHLIIARCSSRF